MLESGRVLALVHCNLKPLATKQGGPFGSYALWSDDEGRTWNRAPVSDVLHMAENPTREHEWGFWEPAMWSMRREDCSCSPVHPPGGSGKAVRSTTARPGHIAREDGRAQSRRPPVLTRVPGGDTLVLIQNPQVDLASGWHGGPRRALAFRTSTDGGHTWSEPADLYRATEEGLWVDYPAIRWIDGNLHMVWRHIRGALTG